MLGTLYCTNGNYVPSIRKCVISKTDVEFDDIIEQKLKVKETEKKQLIDEDVLHIELEYTEDFENE